MGKDRVSVKIWHRLNLMWIFQSAGSSSSQQLSRTSDFLYSRCAWEPHVASQRSPALGVLFLSLDVEEGPD